MVEALLDSKAIWLVMSSEFKKIEKPIYIRNMDEIFNKKEPI